MALDISPWYILIGVIAAGVLITLTRYARSVTHDYVYDALLSFADEFLGGLIGFDFGDWAAAILMYRSERSRVGRLPALFIAWEATNFLPIGLIPGVGTVLEVITNLFPAATLTNVLFNKESKARTYRDKLEDVKRVASVLDVTIDAEEAEAAFDDEDWVEAAHKYESAHTGAVQHVRRSLQERRRNTRHEAYELLQDKQGKRSERARRVRVSVSHIKELLTEAKQSDSLKDQVAKVKAAEDVLNKLRS